MAQSNQQLALLKNRLQIPLIVRELLESSRLPSDDENYAMHDMLGNHKSEDALLCGAFVMKEIAVLEDATQSDIALLHMECERLIERYSARDDLAQENPELYADTEIAMMDSLSEDLEGFLDLLALCKLSYEITAPHIAQILDIVDAQLHSHLMIIDEVINLINDEEPEMPLPTGYEADNVISFPNVSSH